MTKKLRLKRSLATKYRVKAEETSATEILWTDKPTATSTKTNKRQKKKKQIKKPWQNLQRYIISKPRILMAMSKVSSMS